MIEWIMALFPTLSSAMLGLNISAVLKDKEVKGLSMYTLAFFTTYAAWMVFYFHHHNSTGPMIGAALNLIANGAYLALAVYFRSLYDRPVATTATKISR
jgi:hypothetical protein